MAVIPWNVPNFAKDRPLKTAHSRCRKKSDRFSWYDFKLSCIFAIILFLNNDLTKYNIKTK
jgi:hypothetical protein